MKSPIKKIASPFLALLCSAVPLATLADPHCPQQQVFGYYAGYAAFSPDYQAPRHVDMTSMTHLIFARIAPGSGGSAGQIVLGNQEAQTNRNLGDGAPDRTIEEYLIARAHQVGTKALIMLGGRGDIQGFRDSTYDPSVRAAFIGRLVRYMANHAYDGIDVDWEDQTNSTDEAMQETFISELRAAANAHPFFANHPIIITFPGGSKNFHFETITAHDLRMIDLVDYYNIMSYGAGTIGQQWTSTFHSPLTGEVDSRPISIANTINAFVAQGAPRCKLGMGIGFYAMMYQYPIQGPGEYTDDHTQWSTDDTVWNYRQLVKNGYLNDAVSTYVWDTATQTGYRTYPGGWDSNGGHTVGYLSYEDPAGIAAKGAWSKSGAANEGAAGTIIWLVNYGNTDGVRINNPLLTAVKKAFLDPTATEPGADPNPGTLPPLPPQEPEPAPPQVPSELLSYTETHFSDWDDGNGHPVGYCTYFDVTYSASGTLTGAWTIEKTTTDKNFSSQFGLTTTPTTTGTVLFQGTSQIAPGQTQRAGYCANYATSSSGGGSTGGGSTPADLSTSYFQNFNDWGSGWCATAVVVNSGGSAAHLWTVTIPMPTSKAITAFYNPAATWTRSGDNLTLNGVSWADIAGGGGTMQFDMCGQ